MTTTTPCHPRLSTVTHPAVTHPSDEAAWLRAALDVHQLLLGRSDTDQRPWSALATTFRRLLDADVVEVLAPADDAELGLGAVLDRVMALPLVGAAGSLGVVEVRRRSDQPTFTVAEADLARSLAQEVTRALELSDARAAQHRTRLLEDRERIARDLHDQVIQRLFATGLRLQGAATASHDEDDRARLGGVVDELDETVRQIRTTIFALRSTASSTPTLRRAVLEVAESVGSAFGLRPEVGFRGPVDLLVGAAVVEDVVAVVREGVTNAGKHAGATAVQISLSATSTDLRLVIEDDGTGLTGSTRDSGMANLRGRAAQHGGRLSVDASPRGGVRLCWHVPLG